MSLEAGKAMGFIAGSGTSKPFTGLPTGIQKGGYRNESTTDIASFNDHLRLLHV